jgi:hypothetical protein
VVSRSAWQTRIVERVECLRLDGRPILVARTAELVLPKLFADGPQDAWDVAQLLGESPPDDLIAAVESSFDQLPADCRELWRLLRR